MRKLISFILFIALAIITSSCATTKRKYNCKPEIVPQKIIDTIQKGYSIKIPHNWYSYKGIHCALTHSPKEFKSNNYIQGKIKVTSFGNLTKDSNGLIYDDLNSCVKSTIKAINETFNYPKIDVRKLKHDRYGEYRILKFKSVWNGINFTRANVIFYFKNKAYKLHYSGEEKNFNKYINDFTKIVESFTIKE